ncbi:diaminopimelate decarboxylase [Treponema sp. R6D11]
MVSIAGNTLKIEDVSVLDLVEKYGSPAYFISKRKVIQNLMDYKNALGEYYPAPALVLYASKALSAKFMYDLCHDAGAGADFVSGGEIYTASAAGFDMSKTYFHGVNKSPDEIKLAIEKKVGVFVIDGFDDAKNINKVAGSIGATVNAIIRIKPSVDTHTHAFVQTGRLDSQFGFSLEAGEAEEFISSLDEYPNINLIGLHCHIGSQILDPAPFLTTANKIVDFAGLIDKKYGFETKELNLGGGLGVRYTDADFVPSKADYIEALATEVVNACEKNGIPLPKLLIEPGRSTVADAGATVYTIGNIKNIEGVRKYVTIDGGMADNPRYALYESLYSALRVENPNDDARETITVAGRACESGDIILKDAEIAPLKSGDHLLVLGTGAYNYSMASNYNRIPRLPVVLIDGDKSEVVVKRETYEDIIKLDI